MELDQAEKCKSKQKSEKIAKGSFRERKKSLEDEIFDKGSSDGIRASRCRV